MRNAGRYLSGFSLIELLTVVAIIGMIVSISLPQFNAIHRRRAVLAAASEISAILRSARRTAISRSSNVAVSFASAGREWTYRLYVDGDGDGVRNDDIKKGIDTPLSSWRSVLDASETAAMAMPSVPLTDPDTGLLIKNSGSPVKFGTANLASFSPIGGGTAGSVYVSDGFDNVAIVRVFGSTGRVRTLLYDAGNREWRE